MRKLIFSALVVLGFAFQGNVEATQLETTLYTQLCADPGGQDKVYDVLDAAASQLGMSTSNIRIKFEQGDATVEQIDSDTYEVKVVDGGSYTIAVIEEGF